MSLDHFKSLLRSEHNMDLPFVVAYAKETQRVVTFFHLDSTWHLGDTYPAVVQLTLLNVNAKGQYGWIQDWVNPEKTIPAVLKNKLGVTAELLQTKGSWSRLWSEGVEHMMRHHTMVSFSGMDQDFEGLRRVFLKYKSEAPPWNSTFSLRDMFALQRPSRSHLLNDVLQYYQMAPLVTPNAKDRVRCYARLFNTMLSEDGIVMLPSTPNVTNTKDSEEHLDIGNASTKDSVASLLKKIAASARSPLDFFEQVSKHYPLKIARGSKRIQGYSVYVDQSWERASQIDPSLAWSQLTANQHWSVGVDDLAMYERWMDQDPTT